MERDGAAYLMREKVRVGGEGGREGRRERVIQATHPH